MFSGFLMSAASEELDRKQALLAAFPSLSAVDDPVWAGIVEEAGIVEAPQGMVMMCKGDPCNNLMLISDGCLRVHEVSEGGREIVLYRVNPGDLCVLSLTSLVDDVPYGAEAVNETPVTGLVISQSQFQTALAGSAGFRNFVLSTLARRLCDVMSLVEEIAFRRLDNRLACTLYQLFDKSDADTLKITHQDLAKELGTSREVMSRLLKEFEQSRGCIRLRRGAIELVSKDGLADYAKRDFC
jgi:CRP/FNR family transcriptional regulator